MIRVAILGAGIGRAHLEGYRELTDRFSVRSLCDLDRERAAAAAGGEDIEIESDIAKVLADPQIDLVDVCLPPHLHSSVAADALKAGKHVVCEKPLATSLSDADRLLKLAREEGRRLFPVFQYRFGPALSKLQALIDAGLAGKPFVATLETHWSRDSAYYAVPWRGTWAGEKGGAVLGHAIHLHDLLTAILGAVESVTGATTTRVNAIEVEDCAAIALRMKNGALATSSITLGAADDSSRLRFCFEGLTAESGRTPYAPAKDDWTFRARPPVEQSAIDRILAKVPEGRSGFAGFFEALADALEKGGERAVTAEDGRRSIELVTAIYQAAREQRAVELPLGASSRFYDGWMP